MILPESKLVMIGCWGIAVYLIFKFNPNMAPAAFNFEDSAIVTVAEVIGYERGPKGAKLPTIEYHAFNKDYTVSTDFFKDESNQHPVRGEKFDIEVNKHNPKKIRRATRQGINMPLDLVLCLIFLAGFPYIPNKYFYWWGGIGGSDWFD